MLKLWDILTKCNEDRPYSRSLKTLINDDPDFARKLLDNLNNLESFISQFK